MLRLLVYERGRAPMPKRIQMSRQRPWRVENPDAVIVDRTSRFGNPFRVFGSPRHGGSVCAAPWHELVDEWGRPRARDEYAVYVSCSSYREAVIAAVANFRMLLIARAIAEPDRFTEFFTPLRGRDLACWCPLDQPCHGDVLLELSSEVGRA